MVAPSGPVMYPVGWHGLIGKKMYKIIEVRLTNFSFKKAVLLPEIS